MNKKSEKQRKKKTAREGIAVMVAIEVVVFLYFLFKGNSVIPLVMFIAFFWHSFMFSLVAYLQLEEMDAKYHKAVDDAFEGRRSE